MVAMSTKMTVETTTKQRGAKGGIMGYPSYVLGEIYLLTILLPKKTTNI